LTNGLFLRRLVVPVVIAAGLLAMSFFIAEAPQVWTNRIRILNGFTLVALVVWVIQRILRYERRLTNHEAEMLAVIDRGQQQRTKEIATLAEHQAELAAALRDERQQKHQDQQELSGKLDDVLEQGKKES
jgi:cyanate permease